MKLSVRKEAPAEKFMEHQLSSHCRGNSPLLGWNRRQLVRMMHKVRGVMGRGLPSGCPGGQIPCGSEHSVSTLKVMTDRAMDKARS